MRRLVCLAVLAVSCFASGQDFRYCTYDTAHQRFADLLVDGRTIRAFWASSYQFCQWGADVTRVIDASGAFLTPETAVFATCADWGRVAVAALPSGVYAVTAFGSSEILCRLFDSAGNPLTGDLVVSPVGPTSDATIDVTAASPTSFAVVWNAASLYGGIYARIVLADGSMPQGTVTIAQNTPPAYSVWPAIAGFSTGETLIAWVESPDWKGNTSIAGQLFDSSLAPLGASFRISQLQALVSKPGIGIQGSRALVAWGRDVGGDEDLYARWVDLQGGPQGNEFRINDYTPDAQDGPRIAFDAAGRGLVIWQSYGQDGGSSGVYGRRLDARGNLIGTEFRVNMTTFNPQLPNAIAMFPNGDFAIAFDSSTDDTLEADVLMRRFFFPVSLALGPGPGKTNAPLIAWARPDGSAAPPPLMPYGAPGYGATVGSADLDRDGLSEIVTGPGPSPVYGPHVRAFRQDNSPIQKINFYAYGTLRNGVKEAGADIDGDGFDEILTTPGPGTVFGPHVRGWNFDNRKLAPIGKVSFFAFATLRYGANAARPDVDGDSFDEILVGPGPGPVFATQGRTFNFDGASVTSLAGYDFDFYPAAFYGATVAAADIQSDGVGGFGDGDDEMVAGKGPSPANDSEMRIYDYNTAVYWRSVATPFTSMYGCTVAGGDVDAGDTEEVAVGTGPDPAAPARVRCYEETPPNGWTQGSFQSIGPDDFIAFQGPPQLSYGVNLAVGTFE